MKPTNLKIIAIAGLILATPTLHAQTPPRKTEAPAKAETKAKAEAPIAPKAPTTAKAKAADLAKAYTDAAQGGKGEPRTSMPLLYKAAKAYGAASDRKSGLALVEAAVKTYATHTDADKIKSFAQQIRAELTAPGPGEPFKLATFKDLNGKEVDLAAMKGKVVLVDFWATWCGPCVGELPNVKAAYKAHHDQGFEIIAISLDQDETKLRDFIKQNDMPWPQHFDGKGWDNELAKAHGIHSIPATYLIGKDGNIVDTNLRGEDLEAKLAELLK